METQATTVQNSFSLPGLLKTLLVEWFLSSTAHALPNIFRTGSVFLKIVWVCCFIASGTYCLYSVSLSLQDYLTYPSYISTRIVQEIPTPFPAVTICNLKTLNKSVSIDYIYSIPEVPPEELSTPYEYYYLRLFDIRSAFTYDATLSDDQKKAMGYELKNMLVTCFFNSRPCTVNDFTYYFDSLRGNCYTFNKGVLANGSISNVKTLGIAGHMYGLILELFLGDPSVETEYEQSDGVLISIHNQSDPAFTDDARIIGAAGADTDVVVNRNFVSKLEYPYGDCLKDTSKSSTFSSYFFDYIVRTLEIRYLQKYCFSLCLQQEIIIQCNCTNTFMPVVNNTNNQNISFCYYTYELECFQKVVNTFSDKKGATEECEKQCPFACDYIEYETKLALSHYPTSNYKWFLTQYNPLIQSSGISYENLDKAMAKVNVYYKSMGYTLIEEKVSTNTEVFFSNIGGTLGLYLGISILSIVEVVELAYNMIFAVYMYRRNIKLAINMAEKQQPPQQQQQPEAVVVVAETPREEKPKQRRVRQSKWTRAGKVIPAMTTIKI